MELEWEARLEKEGLGSLENHTTGLLKSYESKFFQTRYSKEEFQEKEMYYERARALVHKDVFVSPKDKMIWEMHSEGVPNPEIAKAAKLSNATIERRLALYRTYVRN